MRNNQTYNDTFYMSYRDKQRKKRNLLICILSLLLVASVAGVAGWYFSKPKKDVKVESYTSVCTDIPDVNKIDCHPDLPVSKENCLSRGCCFSESKKNSSLSFNAPDCYYPSNYVGYTIASVDKTPRRTNIKLRRTKPSGFIKDSSNLNIRILHIDDNSLRIKITDEDSERYEVPLQLYYETKKLVKPLYNTDVDKKSGLLTVTRNSTGTIIFQTNLFRLVFSDQFLQLSSDLPSSYIYGIGEHYEKILRNVEWTRFTLINSDLGPIPNHALYGSHPFYMSLEKDGKANGVFLFNSNVMDILLQPAPAITYRPIGGIFDFFIMLGPTPNDVVQQYSSIIGKTFMPPYWSLGFHLCRYGYDSLNKTVETMDRTIKAGIPLDVQWNDIDYMDGYKDFTYDKVNFQGLPEFVNDLHAKGMHYVLMIDPGLSNSEQSYIPYDEGLDDDIFVKNASGSIFVGKVWTSGTTVYPDFSHPLAVSFWTRQFKRLYDDIKFDGVWIDMNEPSNFYNGQKDGCPKSSFENPQYLPAGLSLTTKTLCMTAKHYNSIHYNEHNIYAYREAVATNKAIRSVRKKRPFIISRASFAGQGVYSGHWSGDISSTWKDMRYSIRSLINFNMYAMPMIGSDICGFGGNTTVELCARWQALGAFYPFSRNHNDRASKEQDPVILGLNVTLAAKITLQKRYTLLPYLYTLFYRSHVFGDTVIRPLFFEFSEDNNTYGIDEQFLWGANLMIAQVLYPHATTANVYFPEGVWYDAVTGAQRNSTGQFVEVAIPLIDIHLSVRGGSILPAQTPALTTTETRKSPFTLAVALNEELKAYGELYWDDGDSLETYDNGFYNLIEFQVENGNFSSSVVHSGYQTDMNLLSINVIGFDKFPTNVSVNGIICEHNNLTACSDFSLITATEEKKLLRIRLEAMTDKIEMLSEDLKYTQKRENLFRGKYQEAKVIQTVLNEEIVSHKRELQFVTQIKEKAELTVAEKNTIIERNAATIQELRSDILKLKKDIKTRKEMNSRMNRELLRAKKSLGKSERTVGRLTDDLSTRQFQLAVLRAQKENVELEMRKAKTHIHSLKIEISTAIKQRNQILTQFRIIEEDFKRTKTENEKFALTIRQQVDLIEFHQREKRLVEVDYKDAMKQLMKTTYQFRQAKGMAHS